MPNILIHRTRLLTTTGHTGGSRDDPVHGCIWSRKVQMNANITSQTIKNCIEMTIKDYQAPKMYYNIKKI